MSINFPYALKISFVRYTRVTLSILHILGYHLDHVKAYENGHRSISSLFSRLVEKNRPLLRVQSAKLSCYQPTFARKASRVIAAKLHRTLGLVVLKKQHDIFDIFRDQAPIFNVALKTRVP
jgi:hypothetical protein